MYFRLPIAILMLASLAACGPASDVADNIPQFGKWNDEQKITSVLLNGAAISLDDVPELHDLKKLSRAAKEYCGEPYFRNKEEFQEEVNREIEAECKIDSVDSQGTNISAKGKCSGLNDSETIGSVGFSATAYLQPDNINLTAEIIGVGRSQDTGEGASIKVTLRRKITRIGDC